MHPYAACGPNPAAILKGQIASYYVESPLACRIRIKLENQNPLTNKNQESK